MSKHSSVHFFEYFVSKGFKTNIIVMKVDNFNICEYDLQPVKFKTVYNIDPRSDNNLHLMYSNVTHKKVLLYESKRHTMCHIASWRGTYPG